MKIMHLINHLNIGGIGSYALNLSAGLIKKGHRLFIASSGGELLGEFSSLGAEPVLVPLKTKNELSPKILLSLIELTKVVKANHIDILHSHSRTTQVLGCLLQRLTGVKHIFTCHGFFKRRFSRRVFPCWPDKIIAISDQVREHLINDFKLRAPRIDLVYNGIDTDKFSPPSFEDRQKAKLKIGLRLSPVVGILARLSDVKGHRYLIEAMKDVLPVYPRAQLLIAGEGKMEKELKKLTEDFGIKANVIFVTNTLNAREVLSAIDFFVMPSLNEGLGMALMEAMSMGLAVIGSSVGGIKTLIKDMENGLLVNPKDPRGISQAIISLISDSKKALDLGRNAHKHMANNFSRDKMVLETERIYLKCLQGN
ncbi:MAG: glycosyltransferase family 4 protein [Candidatus Omnitrophica bacterium]|nr:glycosyltransferase family 4 protein [Candidatus Omnitrophota bacterium]MDD5664669.1 glycosyltransferase family 4 protein [Candidatus Omnitrophota bacterium]